MNLCRTCKYWSHHKDRFKIEFGRCSNENVAEQMKSRDIWTEVYMDYSYQEGGGMEPSANFGCVLHEEIKTERDS